jgi:hypothetical protein
MQLLLQQNTAKVDSILKKGGGFWQYKVFVIYEV